MEEREPGGVGLPHCMGRTHHAADAEIADGLDAGDDVHELVRQQLPVPHVLDLAGREKGQGGVAEGGGGAWGNGEGGVWESVVGKALVCAKHENPPPLEAHKLIINVTVH